MDNIIWACSVISPLGGTNDITIVLFRSVGRNRFAKTKVGFEHRKKNRIFSENDGLFSDIVKKSKKAYFAACQIFISSTGTSAG